MKAFTIFVSSQRCNARVTFSAKSQGGKIRVQQQKIAIITFLLTQSEYLQSELKLSTHSL